MTKEFYGITDVVGTVFCEQKIVLTRDFGKAYTAKSKIAADAGTARHIVFEREGLADQRSQAAQANRQDSRCFIATALYGTTAPETIFLRNWRDQVLLPTWYGRVIVKVYYTLAPLLLRTVGTRGIGVVSIRKVLDVFVKHLMKGAK